MNRIVLTAVSSIVLVGGLGYGVMAVAQKAPVKTYQGPVAGDVQSNFLGKMVVAGDEGAMVNLAGDKKSLILIPVSNADLNKLRQEPTTDQSNIVVLPSNKAQDLDPVIKNSVTTVTPAMERNARASFDAGQRFTHAYNLGQVGSAALGVMAGIVGLSIARRR